MALVAVLIAAAIVVGASAQQDGCTGARTYCGPVIFHHTRWRVLKQAFGWLGAVVSVMLRLHPVSPASLWLVSHDLHEMFACVKHQ